MKVLIIILSVILILCAVGAADVLLRRNSDMIKIMDWHGKKKEIPPIRTGLPEIPYDAVLYSLNWGQSASNEYECFLSVVQWEMYVEVKVTDTGKGISESNQAAIFRRFYREEEVHDQQGVGIGLYLAREIVTRQGGYIKVVSELRQGSEFSIMLPVR